jgi:uncharacterized protein YndB with AHSA1/START domain
MDTDTDRIEKKVVLRAPRERVWRAISSAKEFGSWFGLEFEDAFAPNAKVIGRIVPTTVDAEVAKSQEPYRGKAFEFSVDRIEPMRLFSFRWHPYAVDSAIDYSKEPTTLVEFRLEEVAGGTMLTITESGFDQIPLGRRAEAFARNQEGWAAQMKMVEKYVALGA